MTHIEQIAEALGPMNNCYTCYFKKSDPTCVNRFKLYLEHLFGYEISDDLARQVHAVKREMVVKAVSEKNKKYLEKMRETCPEKYADRMRRNLDAVKRYKVKGLNSTSCCSSIDGEL